MNIELYSKTLQDLLQSKIVIRCENKILKSGKLTLFNIKQYFIRFHIENDKKVNKIFELPYPFNIQINENGVCTLNYKLTSLCNNHQATVINLKTLKQSNSHRIYDNVVTITPLT
jgi:hypothetical protein